MLRSHICFLLHFLLVSASTFFPKCVSTLQIFVMLSSYFTLHITKLTNDIRKRYVLYIILGFITTVHERKKQGRLNMIKKWLFVWTPKNVIVVPKAGWVVWQCKNRSSSSRKYCFYITLPLRVTKSCKKSKFL